MDLREALIRDFGEGFDKQAEQMLNSSFISNKDSWVKGVAEDYIRYNVDPNTSIGKLASSHNLNEEQVKRLVEESNVSIYLMKYASIKDNDVRDVVFPLADADKIISAGISAVSSINNDKIASEYSDLTKVASADTSLEQLLIKRDFSNNYESYEPSLWRGTIEKNASTMLFRKTMSDIKARAHEKTASELDVVNKVAVIGNALIHYERAGESSQLLLDKLASDADWYGAYQTPVLRYVDKALEMNKEASRLPGNFGVSIRHSDLPESNPYSLGKHSLIEKSSAELIVNVDKLPENVTYDDLVNFAKVIKTEVNENPPRKREVDYMEGKIVNERKPSLG